MFEGSSYSCKGVTIYVHNLAGFDSMFLLKPLIAIFDEYKLISDNARDVFNIELPGNVTIKDSKRILPGSLFDLSVMFNVPVPKGSLDHASVTFNNLVDIQDVVLIYLNKDLISLLDVMLAASLHLFSAYHVDLSTVFSASSLAMKIYRTNFLGPGGSRPEGARLARPGDVTIPQLPSWLEQEIRSRAYVGGAVQKFATEGRDLY
ncbi:hypothetical protein BC936DRAFT_137628 [Jimgerdemannia flammicorona]|uniref:Uncharacterized protein n=2 Tax=Jimgerdemannia flammicorona TaxID=994334 RepID=A0A433DIX4_9FUNG|nr:hypothetical protein BC936DRAFT_137628 [Jimgerdemannia flammicorona]RUS17509.1 hypothetical protein BC938DRAFT_476234 [Jimgerdemannia flammicorona]